MKARTTLRRIVSLAALFPLVASVIVAQGAPAHADYDYGDGSANCNSGEICFYGDEDFFLIKHFWYGANHHSVPGRWGHGPYTWFDTWDWQDTDDIVMDHAIRMTNKDTACRVYVWNVDGSGNWYIYVSQAMGKSVSFTPRNNGHSRCTTTAPITL